MPYRGIVSGQIGLFFFFLLGFKYICTNGMSAKSQQDR